MILLGRCEGKQYSLDQDPLTKEITLYVDNLMTGSYRKYNNKRMIAKIFSMVIDYGEKC